MTRSTCTLDQNGPRDILLFNSLLFNKLFTNIHLNSQSVFMRIDDGMIVEHWDVVYQLGMLATLGLVTVNHPQLE